MKPNTEAAPLSEIAKAVRAQMDARADEIRAPLLKALTEERAAFAEELHDLREVVVDLMDLRDDVEKLKKGATIAMPVRSAHLVPQGDVAGRQSDEIRGLELALTAASDPAAQVALRQRLNIAKVG